MMIIPKITSEEIQSFLIENGDNNFTIEEFNSNERDQLFEQRLTSFFNEEKLKKVAVLGIDIYKYSKYDLPKQNYIPFIFDYIYQNCVINMFKTQKFLFQNYQSTDINKFLISTGDGGFQLMETPLHALIFAIIFEATFRSYNSFTEFPKLRNFIGELTLRYTLTYDYVYSFNDNFYGPAIINNSRILSKDKLNRFLIDEKSYHWFLQKVNGIESLKILTLKEISNLTEFSAYDKAKLEEKNLIFSSKTKNIQPIQTINISKLQTIEVKDTNLNIYNLHMQLQLVRKSDENSKILKRFVITIGNLNPEGISI